MGRGDFLPGMRGRRFMGVKEQTQHIGHPSESAMHGKDGGGVAPRSPLWSRLKQSLKSALGWIMFQSRLYRWILPDRAVIVVFHRVDNRYPGNGITATSDEFERFVKFFHQFFRIVPLSELLQGMRSEQRLRGLLVITFDDGYADNVLLAAPILARYKAPACFFVTTGMIESEIQPSWDQRSGITSEWMTWAQVRALRAAGHEIGAHTVTHPDLATLDVDSARQEIRGARQRLEQELGEPITLFAYPYGGRSSITEAVRRIVREEGFVCCLGAYGGTVGCQDDPLALPRIPVSPWFRSPYQFGFELLTGQLNSDDGTVVT
jgi:peptidoglycan/xylan/chitin deacetylase (PgdA/CDA1 family)